MSPVFSTLAVRAGLAALALTTALGTAAQVPARGTEDLLKSAREAFTKRDRARLASLKAQALEQRDPLAPWVDYWELGNRLAEVRADEVEAFYARWPGSYVEDRLRNDWLLETGRRRDWAAFAKDRPRFRMNDDREVVCYDLVQQHLSGKDVVAAARRAWIAQRDPGDGCLLLAQTLYDAKAFSANDVWRQVRHAVEYGRLKSARAAAAVLGERVNRPLADALDNPTRYMALKASALDHMRAEVASLAIARIASTDPDQAARLMTERWADVLGADHGAWAWAIVARQGAVALRPESIDWTRTAWRRSRRAGSHSATSRGSIAPRRAEVGTRCDVVAGRRTSPGFAVEVALPAGAGSAVDVVATAGSSAPSSPRSTRCCPATPSRTRTAGPCRPTARWRPARRPS